ncbi:hypothetical protein EDD16DRAFT_1525764 [Pisolithus croceorrhizus]|nr:hypothetical protein EDD16DRAFT_1525764 [Pisolithus croceorrhizus]
MSESERFDAKVSEIHEPDLATLSKYKNSNTFGTTNARATSCISSGPSQRKVYHLRGIVEYIQNPDPNGLQQPPVDSLEPVQRLRLTHGYYEMTECHSRQQLLFSRLAGWWAGLGWAHPSNFPVNASITGSLEGSLEGSCRNQGCMAYLSTSTAQEGACMLEDSLCPQLGAWGCSEAEGQLGPSTGSGAHNGCAKGGEGALMSGAETHLVEPFGSAAFNYPHPPRIPAIQMVLESVPRHFPVARYFLHELQFAQIWPFWPQKKQNKYVQWGEQLMESVSIGLKE